MGEQITIDPKRFGGPSAQARGKEDVQTTSTQTSTAATAAANQRANAEFILKYGIEPGAVKPLHTVPGDPNKTGEEYLKTLDPALARQVVMLAEGRRTFPKGAALRSPQAMQLIAAATQYDPQLDEANAATRAATRRDFTSGQSARNLTSLNTAIGHLASLRDFAVKLNNSRFPDLNSFINAIQSERFGDPRVNNFKTTAKAFAAEMAKVFKGTGSPSLTELKEWEDRIDANMSPDQLQGFIRTAADLLNSRVLAVGDTYNRGLSKSSDPITLLSPHAQELYKTLERPLDETVRRDVFEAPRPDESLAGGENVKGWRFSPDSEATISEYYHRPDATAAGYGALVAELAVKEGHVPPSQQADYAKRNELSAQDFFAKSPEQRAKAQGIDYQGIDKAATENAGLLSGVAQTVSNAPQSLAGVASGAVALPIDALKSALTGERAGSFKSFTDLAMEAGQGQWDGPTIKAFSDAMQERYGSVDALKRTMITDPAGTLGDISLVLTGGGTVASRLPGKFGSFAQGVAQAGKIIDPLSGLVALGTEGVPALYRTAKEAIPEGATRAVTEIPSEIGGLPSGAGGAALREGAGAGFERGRVGQPTPRSEAYTANMREPTANASSAVDVARNAVANLRSQASAAYVQAMQKFGKNPVPLPPDALRQTMADMRPKNYDAMLDAPHRPADHIAWQQMNDTVEHYLGKAASDPSLLEPLAVDQFKQDLYSIGSKIGGATDRDAARISGNAYRAVKKMLTDHDSVYAEIMAPYQKAAEEALSLESGFSLSSPRGKPINIDRATRRLLSTMRNNANTNYGQRASQAERLAELDPTGTLMPSLAGQTVSSWTPRGIRAGVEGAGLTGLFAHSGAAALLDPTLLFALATSSPRVAGETAYGLGRLAGTGARAVDKVVSSKPVATLADLYQKYPTAFLAGEQAQSRLEDTEAERRRRLLEQYLPGVSEVPAPYGTGE